METPTPAPSSSAALRAGAFVVGVSILALTGAVAVRAEQILLSLDHYVRPPTLGGWMGVAFSSRAHPGPLLAWIALTLAAFALAVRFAFGGAPRGSLELLERGFRTLVATSLIAAAILFPVETQAPSPEVGGVAPYVVLLIAGGVLLLSSLLSAFVASRPVPVIPAPAGATGLLPTPDAAPEQAPGTYGLAGGGPPVSAAETERDAPAVEVRVLWGGDLLRVTHLAPPRSFSLGEDGSVVGVRTAGAPAVIVPPGAGAVVTTAGGERLSLDRAIDAAQARPFEGAGGGTAVALAPGVKVTVTLGRQGGTTAYRAAGSAGDDPGGVPLAVEIAHVKAGRVVGRGGTLRGRRAHLGLAVLVAGVAARVIALEGAKAPPASEDDGERAFLVAARYAFEAIDQRVDDEEPPPTRTRDFAFPSWGEDICSARRRDDFVPTFFMVPWDYWLELCTRHGGVIPLGLELLPDAPRLVEAPVLPIRDDELRSAEIHLGVTRVSGRLPPVLIHRGLREGRGHFRACYVESLALGGRVHGVYDMRFLVDRRGVASYASIWGPRWSPENTSPPPEDARRALASCLTKVVRGLSFPVPEAGIVTVEGRIELGLPLAWRDP